MASWVRICEAFAVFVQGISDCFFKETKEILLSFCAQDPGIGGIAQFLGLTCASVISRRIWVRERLIRVCIGILFVLTGGSFLPSAPHIAAAVR